MRKMLSVGMVSLMVLCNWADVSACGDKFPTLARAIKFSRAWASVYPGTVVMYVPQAPGRKDLPKVDDLRKYLAKAGHKVSLVRDTEALGTALRGNVDIVMAPTGETRQVVSHVAQLASRPAVVALIAKRQAEPAGVHAGFAGTVATADSPKDYLPAVDQIMKAVTDGRTRK